MSSKRKAQISDADIEYLHENVKYYVKKNVYDAKSLVLLCKTFCPNNGKVKVMEYELAKEMGNLKHAANVLVSNYHFRDTLWESEVASMFSGLISNPPNHQYQKLFMALPLRAQSDFFMEYLDSNFSSAESKAEFILQFINEKSDIFGGSQFLAFLCHNLIELLSAAEKDYLKSRVASVPEERLFNEPKPVSSVSDSKPPKPQNDTEEGEVLEELGESGEEDFEEDELSDGKNITVRTNYVLNVFRMKLACEVLPFIHKFRNNINFDGSQMQTVVFNSLQFIFAFASEMPFRTPEISGPPCSLPGLLKLCPVNYFRTFLDMASDLLNWPVKGPSFQVQPRLDILELLRNSFHIYKDLEHDAIRSSSKKRTSAVNHKLSAVASQAICIYWSLFIEVAVDYLIELKSSQRCPFKASAIGFVSEQSPDLPLDVNMQDLFSVLQSLSSLRARYIPEAAPKMSKSATSTLSSLEASLRAQSSEKYSGLLELIIGLHLSLSGCIGTISNSEEVFSRPSLAEFYTLDQVKFLRSLYIVTNTSQQNGRPRILDCIAELSIGPDIIAPQAWKMLSNGVVSLDISTSVDVLGISIAAVETRLAAGPQSTDIAALVYVMHQNPIWLQLTNSNAAHLGPVISALRSDWSYARGLLLPWLTSGFIADPNFVAQIVRLETQSNQVDGDDADFLDICAQCMRTASISQVMPMLFRFFNAEKDRIKSCLVL